MALTRAQVNEGLRQAVVTIVDDLDRDLWRMLVRRLVKFAKKGPEQREAAIELAKEICEASFGRTITLHQLKHLIAEASPGDEDI